MVRPFCCANTGETSVLRGLTTCHPRASSTHVRWRPGHLALIVFQAFWLNVVLPGHVRGVVTLPGTCLERACCHRDQPVKNGQMPAKRVANCAVCAFAARLDVPPAVDLGLGRLGLAGIVQVRGRGAVASIEFVGTYLGRGPPVAV